MQGRAGASAGGVQGRIQEMIRTALGPASAFLGDDSVVEIMANSDGSLWIERFGEGMSRTSHGIAPGQIENFLRLVASSTGLEIHAGSPRLSAVLPGEGARLQGFVPPVVVSPTFSLRKPPGRIISLEEMEAGGVITATQREIMTSAVLERKNVIIAGGTGAGKTTLATALLAVIAQTGQRIVTIEDTHELRCAAANAVALYTRPGLCSMHDLVIDTLRVRPDRIIIGEMRDGAAALEGLKAFGTGHPGGLTTIHADGALQALSRLEQLIQEVVVTVPRQFIAEVVDIVVYTERFGTRVRVDGVHAVGFDGGEYVLTRLDG